MLGKPTMSRPSLALNQLAHDDFHKKVVIELDRHLAAAAATRADKQQVEVFDDLDRDVKLAVAALERSALTANALQNRVDRTESHFRDLKAENAVISGERDAAHKERARIQEALNTAINKAVSSELRANSADAAAKKASDALAKAEQRIAELHAHVQTLMQAIVRSSQDSLGSVSTISETRDCANVAAA